MKTQVKTRLLLFVLLGLAAGCGSSNESNPSNAGGTAHDSPSAGSPGSGGAATPPTDDSDATPDLGDCSDGPKTCADLDKSCGQWWDGCNSTLECGACSGDAVCAVGLCVPPESVAHTRADNPFEGARFYVNPEYTAHVMASKTAAPAALASAIDKAAILPTGVWLDRIAALDGSADRLGLEGHLNEALAQQAQSQDPSQPMLVTLVVYDLPNRDCAAFASNGELLLAEDGLQRYREEYINEIASRISANPAYKSLRIVTILEPDSLPNLVTNLGIYGSCRDAEPGYREGVKYAVSTLGAIENVYVYLDIAHSGWLGWEHTERAAQVYQEVLGQELDKIRGFAVNVANYSVLREPSDPYVDVNANRDIIEGFYEWNRIIDEASFVQELRKHFPEKGIVIDTSRNGWRATSDGSPIEKRTHRGNWCNIDGAGMGERPRANPEPGVDAYFFIKPPGESDGTSDAEATSPNEEGKRFDPMCGQAPVERPYAVGKSIPTDALPSAPHAGQWFHEQFLMLVENATPPL